MKNWQYKNYNGVIFNIVDLVEDALKITLKQDGDILTTRS